MMTRRCMAASRTSPDQAAKPAPTARGRWIGARRNDRLRRQPGLEEASLAFGGGPAGHGAERPPARPLEAPALEGIGFESDHETERQHSQAGPALVDARKARDGL